MSPTCGKCGWGGGICKKVGRKAGSEGRLQAALSCNSSACTLCTHARGKHSAAGHVRAGRSKPASPPPP
eukprot:213022-Chlamydomonas_euryale.AAC.15